MRKNRTIIEFSNFKNPYIKVTSYGNSAQIIGECFLPLANDDFENGALVNPKAVAEQIKTKLQKIYPILFLVSCQESYKSVFSLPKMSKSKAVATFRKQFKKEYHPEFAAVTDFFSHSLGFVFNCYFIPNRCINCLKQLAKFLGARVTDFKLFGMFLKDSLPFKQDYAYLHIRNHLCRLLLVVANQLVTLYEFAFESEHEIQSRFLQVISKHEFEFERKPILYYGIDSDIPFDLDIGLKRIDRPDEVQSELGIEIEFDNPQEYLINDRPTTFSERLQHSPEYVRNRYHKITDCILAYSDVKLNVTDVCAVALHNNLPIFKIDINFKNAKPRLALYFAEDIQTFRDKGIAFAISKKQNFLNTPCLVRVSTRLRYLLALRLIKEFCADHDIQPMPEPLNP